MENPDQNSPTKERSPWLSTTRGRLLFALLIVLLLVALAIPLFFFGNMMMGAAPMSESQFAAAAPETRVEIACEILEIQEDGILVGAMLERSDAGAYSRTSQKVYIRWQPESTSIVMGQEEDVLPGAILQVSGVLDAEGILDADQIVILTSVIELP